MLKMTSLATTWRRNTSFIVSYWVRLSSITLTNFPKDLVELIKRFSVKLMDFDVIVISIV